MKWNPGMQCREIVRAVSAVCIGLTMFLIGGEEWHHPNLPTILAQPVERFIVFDGTLYKNKPDLSTYGIRPIRIMYRQEFWESGENVESLPTRERVETVASSVNSTTTYAVVDIEHWPTSPPVHKVSVETAEESVAKYGTVLGWFREAAPRVRVGLYGVIPMNDYWRAIEPTETPRYQEWVSDNERVLPLVELVDALYPSLYTFYVDQEGWVKYATAQLTEAKRLAGGRPVYAFLWPQFHDSNKIMGGRYLPPEYWKLELDTVRKLADGVVIWGGWVDNGPASWDENAGWWTITKTFLQSLDVQVLPPTPQNLRRN